MLAGVPAHTSTVGNCGGRRELARIVPQIASTWRHAVRMRPNIKASRLVKLAFSNPDGRSLESARIKQILIMDAIACSTPVASTCDLVSQQFLRHQREIGLRQGAVRDRNDRSAKSHSVKRPG